MKSVTETRKPYRGHMRGLVIALDVGTTFSGVSYAILEPNTVPRILGVTRFPGQEHVAGDSKIPSIIWYDRDGQVRAAGAEAERESILAEAEDYGYHKAELFKLRLRPKSMTLHMNGMALPPLPPHKSPVDVLADFLGYLFRCTRAFIEDTHPGGHQIWAEVEHQIQFVLSHPNGWEGAQQSKMRRAAARGGLIPDTDAGRARIRFVTEGEASLHACVLNGLTNDVISDPGCPGFVVADAGGGTLDISSYAIRGTNPLVIEEVAPPDCMFAGSVFVSRRARAFLGQKLANSNYGRPDSLDHITRKFDETTKRLFRDVREAQYIAFGSPLDKDPAVGIRSGQLKLTGEEVADLFEPSIQAAVQAIESQVKASNGTVRSVWLVGGFAASPWLFSQLTERLGEIGVTVSRPDTQVSKAVADGAVGFYCDHHVSARVAKFMYGVEYLRSYDPNDPDHVARKNRLCELPSGPKLLLDAFDCILARGVKVKESTVFSRKYCTELTSLSTLSVFEVEIWCYRGGMEVPKWIERNQEWFSTLCLVRADLSPLTATAQPKAGKSGKKFWTIVFSIEIHFGLTEFKARIKWVDNDKSIKYGPASIVYAEAGTRVSEVKEGYTDEDGTATHVSRATSQGISGHIRPHGSRSVSGSEVPSARTSVAPSQYERPSASRMNSYTSRSIAPSTTSRTDTSYSQSAHQLEAQKPPMSRAGSGYTSRSSRAPAANSYAPSAAPSAAPSTAYDDRRSHAPSAAPTSGSRYPTSRQRKDSLTKSVAFSESGRPRETPRTTNDWANTYGTPDPLERNHSYSETIASNLESVWGPDGAESVGPSISQQVSRAPTVVHHERDRSYDGHTPRGHGSRYGAESHAGGHTPKPPHSELHEHETIPASAFNNDDEDPDWDQGHVPGDFESGLTPANMTPSAEHPAHVPPMGDPSLDDILAHAPSAANGGGGMFGGGWGSSAASQLNDVISQGAAGGGGGWLSGAASTVNNFLSKNPSAADHDPSESVAPTIPPAPETVVTTATSKKDKKGKKGSRALEPEPEPEPQHVEPEFIPVPVTQPPEPQASEYGASTTKKGKKGKRNMWEEPEAPVEATPAPEPQPTPVEEPEEQHSMWGMSTTKKGQKGQKAGSTWGAAESTAPAKQDGAPAAADDWFNVGAKNQGADDFNFGADESVVAAPTVAETTTTPAAEEAGAEDWFGGPKKGKKNKKAAASSLWEDSASAAPEKAGVPAVEESVAPGSTALDVPGGFGGASAAPPPPPAPAVKPMVASTPSADSQGAGGGWFGKTVAKKVGGGLLGGWGGGWGASQEEENMVIPSPEPAPQPDPVPEPEPVPVVETKVEEPEDDWFNPVGGKKGIKKTAGTAKSTVSAVPPAAAPVVAAPVTPAAAPEPPADDWFSAAKNRKSKKGVGEELPIQAAPSVADDMVIPGPPAPEEDDWFKNAADSKKKKNTKANEPPPVAPEPEKPKEEPAPAPAPAPAAADDWFAPAATKKKAKKGKK